MNDSINRFVSRLSAGILLLTLLAFLSGCARKDAEEIKIGVVLSLTGRGATYGERALRGMQLGVDELNATESFRIRPLKLLVEDSQSSSAIALSAFRKLINIHKVGVVVGLVLSDEVLACAPVANEKRVVLFTTAAGSDKIKDAGDYVFRNRESAALQAEVIARAAVQSFGFREIAILHSNAANGISYMKNFKDQIEHLGGKIQVIVAYNEDQADFRAEIEQVRSKSPQAVYLAGLDRELGLILRQAKEAGFAPQFFASPGAISNKLIEIAGAGAEGLVSASASFDPESDDPGVLAFTEAFESHFGEIPDWIAANSYDAVHILAARFRDGASGGDQIKQGLYATQEFQGVGGLTTFDLDGEVIKPLVLLQVHEGRFVHASNKGN